MIPAPLSAKATCPVSFVEPDGTGIFAVKVTVWFTVEVLPGDEELSVMLLEALLTV